MKRALTALAIVVSLTGCGGINRAILDSPAGKCLIAAGYAPYDKTESVMTFLRDNSPSITLKVFDGIAQPSTPSSLREYVALGCR